MSAGEEDSRPWPLALKLLAALAAGALLAVLATVVEVVIAAARGVQETSDLVIRRAECAVSLAGADAGLPAECSALTPDELERARQDARCFVLRDAAKKKGLDPDESCRFVVRDEAFR